MIMHGAMVMPFFIGSSYTYTVSNISIYLHSYITSYNEEVGTETEGNML